MDAKWPEEASDGRAGAKRTEEAVRVEEGLKIRGEKAGGKGGG